MNSKEENRKEDGMTYWWSNLWKTLGAGLADEDAGLGDG